MGFKNYMDELLEDYDREEHEDILETARIISADDKELVKQVTLAIDKPEQYFKDNAERFGERGIDFEDEEFADELDMDELLLLAMVDELEQQGYAVELDWKCELEDFLWGLEQTKNYNLISDVIQNVKLDEDKDIEMWGKEFNTALSGKVHICYIDIDSDSYPLVIVTAEALKNIPIPMVISM